MGKAYSAQPNIWNEHTSTSFWSNRSSGDGTPLIGDEWQCTLSRVVSHSAEKKSSPTVNKTSCAQCKTTMFRGKEEPLLLCCLTDVRGIRNIQSSESHHSHQRYAELYKGGVPRSGTSRLGLTGKKGMSSEKKMGRHV